MKGYLDVKDLEKYKKADLQELAEKLGVSKEGTVKEIAERCAAVEVEIPEENEQEKEETRQQKQAAGNIVAIQTYDDLQLKRIVEAGETLDVSEERATQLINLKLARPAE